MILKRIVVCALCLVIVGATAFYTFSYRFFDKILSGEQKEAFCSETSLPDGFLVVAAADTFDVIKNTDESLISNYKSGSYALELNVSFTDKGVPVLADSYEYITDGSVTLESVFEKFKNKSYLNYIINVSDFSDCSLFNALALKYNLTDRIIISGFGIEDFDTVATALYSYPVCVDLGDEVKDLSDVNYCQALIDEIDNYGIHSIRCSIDKVTKEFADTIYENQTLKLIISDVDSDFDMYHALSLNPNGIISKNPHEFYSILVENNFLDYKR